MFDNESLIEAAKQLGFAQAVGKGRGVLDKTVTKRGEQITLILLTSQRDATMMVYHSTGSPFKFQFKRNYKWAADFIKDYIGDSK